MSTVKSICCDSDGKWYTVLEAEDGNAALAAFRENKDQIKLLLSDIIMPKMSGKQLYQAISREIPEIRAIFISGYTGAHLNENQLLDPAVPLIQKPVRPYELARIIREALDR